MENEVAAKEVDETEDVVEAEEVEEQVDSIKLNYFRTSTHIGRLAQSAY